MPSMVENFENDGDESPNPSPPSIPFTPLINSGPPELVDLLLEGARYGDEEDIEQALSSGVHIDAHDSQGRTALHMASANGNASIVKLILKFKPDVNRPNIELNTPLHYASLNGHLEVVEILMENEANPSAINRYDHTPVDEALSKGHNSVLDIINHCVAQRSALNLTIN